MKTRYTIWMFTLTLAVASCGGGQPRGAEETGTLRIGDTVPEVRDPEAMKKKIAELESLAFNESRQIDDSVGRALMRIYQEYYNAFPRNAETPEMLYRCADVARGLGKYKQCVVLLSNLHDGYPEFPKRDEVAFLIGFTYDSALSDTVQAIKAYQRVSELYPTSHWAEEAKNNIKLLQMSEQEMLEFLHSGNKPS